MMAQVFFNKIPVFRLVAAALLLALNSMSPLRAEEWVEVRTPNFTVISSARTSEATAVAQQFEQFRRVIQDAMPQLTLDPGQPIIILALRDSSEFRQLAPRYWEKKNRVKPAGIFLRGPERHFVVLRLDVAEQRPFQTIYHEYFHLLVSLNLPWAPLWLNEGLAEFYGNTSFRDRDVIFGLPNFNHVELLRRSTWLPLEQLLAVEEGSPLYDHADTASIYYSQCWALLHYLILEDSRLGTSRLPHLLELLESGRSSLTAARQALGDLKLLQADLRKYVREAEFSFYQYPEPVVVETGGFGVRALTAAESAAIRASFLVRSGRNLEAQALIARALQTDPRLALAHESQGNLFYAEGRTEEALSSFSEAIALNSASYLSHYLYGYLSLEVLGRTDRKVETSLRKAIRLRPGFAYSYSALATLLLRRESGPQEALELAQEGARLEPNNPQLLHTYAYALSRAGKLKEAEELLIRIRAFAETGENPQVRESLTQLSDYLLAQRRHLEDLREMEAERSSLRNSRSLKTVRGRVRRVSCTTPATLELVLDTLQGTLSLDSKNFAVIKFLFTSPPASNFHPCEALRGKAVTVEYSPDPTSSRKRIVSVRLN